jgi:subtilisin family serine protease
VKFPRFVGRRRPTVIAVSVIAAGATALGLTTAGSAQAEQQLADTTQLYVVQVAGDPVASYDGDIAGLAATRPAKGKKLDADSAAANAYRNYLNGKHRDVLDRSSIAESKKIRDLSTTFNGFTARLTEAEARQLEHTKGVTNVWKNEIVEVDTITTPTFLGLAGANGVWNRQFGGASRAGEGVIVGVLDSGFTPENPMFGALPEPRPDQAIINAKWDGECVAGEEEVVTCNNKVLGARWYNAAGLAQPFEFLSPRDFNGHGTHTSSTAAGNNNIPATINGGSVGNVSGMAPAARLSIYKVLWHNPVTGGSNGGTADILAAIDDAVGDGVDVINYSISGSRTLVRDPVEVAFLNVASAGVFVAASAGNDGATIGVSSVAHNSPWLTTVAASTHDRGAAKTVTLGSGASFSGVGVGPAVPSSPLIDSVNAGLPGAPATSVQLCFSDADNNPSNGVVPVLDPALVTGKIVLCERGVNDRVNKSLAVKNAGGIGMILFNPTPNSLNADFHAIPSIHVDHVAGPQIKAYAATASPTAAISAVSSDPVRAPEMAGFSSFGPALAGGGDLLKPDITAPGVDVIAAISPRNPANGLNNFNAFSGTSMSSPHIAGIAALLASENPNWSPMWIKSALMTSATPLDNTDQPIRRGASNASPLDFGSGHVVPSPAFDPGLVYDSGFEDWASYGCALGQFQLITAPGFCAGFPARDASDLNYPSIAIGDVAGTQTVTRTVTNITQRASTYGVTVQAPAGFTATVSPTTLVVRPGMSQSYTVTLTRTTAALNQWSFGSLTWIDKDKTKRDHSVRSPIAVRPVPLAVPNEVTLTGTTGSSTISATIGYTGTLNTTVAGLLPATVNSFNLDTTGPDFTSSNPMEGPQVGKATVVIPAGTTVARFATFDADYPANTDVDIFVYRLTGATPPRVLVASSAGGTAEEVVTLNNPLAATYEVYVDLFDVDPGTTMTVDLNHWLLSPGAAGNLTATPASQAVTTATAATITLNWTGLTAGVRYLGTLTYSDGSSDIGRTVVGVHA